MNKIGVQSWCFREFKPLDRLIEKLKECKFSTVELCSVHADFNKPESVNVIKPLKDAGIRISSIGVERFKGAPEEEMVFKFAKQAGCEYIAVDFPIEGHIEALNKTSILADKYQINLGIHNHGGGHWLGSRQALTYVFGISSQRIGLCLDTAWALDAGQDPLKLSADFYARLYGLHLKDFIFDKQGNPEDVILGTGVLELTALLDFLKGKKFSGPLTIEYEGEAANPATSLMKCAVNIK